MTIDKRMVPKIPDTPLGVSREILGDPCGGDGGGGGQRRMRDWSEGRTRSNTARRKMGAQQGEQRGSRSSTERRQMRDRGFERRTGHARYAAEEPEVYRRNTRDGTWRRSGGVPQPGSVSSAQGSLWRPWVAQEESEETLQTIVSIPNPENFNRPVYFSSTDIRTRSQLQRGKLSVIYEGTSFTFHCF